MIEYRHIKASVKEVIPTIKVGTALVAMYLFVVWMSTVALDTAAKIEGKFSPVITDVEITKIVPEGSGVLFSGTAFKRRDCRFINLVWYLKKSTDIVDARLDLRENAKVRDIGPFKFGPWFVAITPIELVNESFALATHNCHGFWQTETVFFGEKP